MEAETFLRNLMMNNDKRELQNKIEQVNADINSLTTNKMELEQQLKALKEPTYKPGDIIRNNYGEEAQIVRLGSNAIVMVNVKESFVWCSKPLEFKDKFAITRKELDCYGFQGCEKVN